MIITTTINLISIAQLDTNGILAALYIVLRTSKCKIYT